MALVSGTARQKSSAGSMLKHLTDALVGLGGALEVLVGANLLADLLTLRNSVSHMQSVPVAHI